ncbi:hypothetical protein QVD17_13340 [Tagetes erecta]|uniref:Uncharacterized protein n=1 Tax=Tagetes erecta TaxID=13708 RepID=A0AAD8P3E3_TARER|nr:hypothetical protein QVD17_13340 [Tagetes erecta]
MNQPTTGIDIPASEQVAVVGPQPAKTKIFTFFTIAYLLQCMGHIYRRATIPRGVVAPIRHAWACYYPRVAFGEQGVVMPHSTFGFIINALLAFVEIKSQGRPGFPFQTHSHVIMFSVTSLLMYGLASAVELVVFAVGVDRRSVYAVVAHLGKICCLCVLVVSLASLFYF